MNNGVLTQTRDVQIPFWRKLCFGGNGFARMSASSLISAYAVYYYTDVLGLSGTLVGMIILISKIWDFINDPMMGAIVDRTQGSHYPVYQGPSQQYLLAVRGGHRVVLRHGRTDRCLLHRTAFPV